MDTFDDFMLASYNLCVNHHPLNHLGVSPPGLMGVEPPSVPGVEGKRGGL